MRQVETSIQDRQLWGRIINGYNGAYGTGSRHIDPEASLVGVDGHIWMRAPIEKYQLQDAWVGSGMSTTDPNSAWQILGNYTEFAVLFNGYKLKKGMFSGAVWAASVKFQLDDSTEVAVGWLSGKGIQSVFQNFDKWLQGSLMPLYDVHEALRSV